MGVRLPFSELPRNRKQAVSQAEDVGSLKHTVGVSNKVKEKQRDNANKIQLSDGMSDLLSRYSLLWRKLD